MTPEQIQQLRQLIAGIGASGVQNLHISDPNHDVTADYNAFHDPRVIQAMRAGGFGNAVIEGPLSYNNGVGLERRRRFAANGVHAYYPDARFPSYRVAVAGVSEDLARIYDRYPGPFLVLAQRYRDRTPTLAELRTHFPNPAEVPDNVLEQMRTALPRVWDKITDHDLNAQTTDNIRARFPDGAGGRIFFYGAGHINGVDTQQRLLTHAHELRGESDLDTAFPGLNIVILSSRENSPENIEERNNAINWSDPPDIVYYLDEPEDHQIEDLRTNPVPPLAQLLQRGEQTLRAAGPVRPVPLATVRDVPVIPPTPGAGETPANEDDPSTDGTPTPGNGRRVPWGNLIGAGIGAWLTSAMGGNGFGRIIAMLIGGLLGWVMGGAMGGNHGSPFLGLFGGGRDNDDAQTPPQPEATHQPQVTTIIPEPDVPARALAFANVTSISAPLETSDASPAELLDAPQNFYTAPITPEAITLH